MKTLFLITILVFGWCAALASAQTPDVALSAHLASGTKVFTSSHLSADNFIPTGAGDSSWRGYLIEDLPPGPLDTTFEIKLKLVSNIDPAVTWTPTIAEYSVIFNYNGSIFTVIGQGTPTFTDLSGLGICAVTELGSLVWLVESCTGSSNGTGLLVEAGHNVAFDSLLTDGSPQANITLIEAKDRSTGDDLLNGLGCDPGQPICFAADGLHIGFTLTHYGTDPAIFGYGNGPKMKADSATVQVVAGLTCDPLSEIGCADHLGAAACRQPHLCNNWGDADGNNMINTTDLVIIGGFQHFNSGLDVAPDDQCIFRGFDPTPESP